MVVAAVNKPCPKKPAKACCRMDCKLCHGLGRVKLCRYCGGAGLVKGERCLTCGTTGWLPAKEGDSD